MPQTIGSRTSVMPWPTSSVSVSYGDELAANSEQATSMNGRRFTLEGH